MKKRFILITIIGLLLAVLPLLAGAETGGTCGTDLTWLLDDNGVLTISGTGEMKNHPWNASDIVEVKILDGVTNICDYAFSGCSSLTNIILPDGITGIGYRAFSGCSSLEHIVLPDSMTSIGSYAFYNCSSLKSIFFPDNVKSIGNSMFGHGMSSVVAYASLDSDAAKALSKAGNSFRAPGNQYDLRYLYTNDEISGLEILNCDKDITSFVIPDGVTSIGNGGNYYGAFYDCSKLTNITIPDSVTSIGARAFYHCSSLTSISIPDSVTSIGESAFFSCSSLTSISIPDSVTTIGESAFSSCSNLISAALPNSMVSLGDRVFCNCYKLMEANLPDGITSIGYGTFWSCNNLLDITIPDSVTSIGQYAFCNCYALKEMIIPDSVTSIGDDAFNHCDNLKSITIPNSVASIGNGAFRNCTFTSAIIPESVTHLGDYAFAGNDNLTKMCILSRDTEFGTDMFKKLNVNIYCHNDSSAVTWAESQGYNVVFLEDINPEEECTIELPSTIRLSCGSSRELHATIYPIGDPEQLRWSVNNPEIATVENGVVTALSPGSTNITATFGDKSGSIYFTSYIPAEWISLEKTEIFAIVNDWVSVPKCTVYPEDAQAFVTWDFDAIDTGGYSAWGHSIIVSENPGNIIIHAKGLDGQTAECIVHFSYPVTAIQFEQTDILIPAGADRLLTANVTMRDRHCVNHLVTFTSSDETVATVDADGVVHAVSIGDAIITATSASDKTASASIHVVPPCETHVPETDPAVPATCAHTGLTEGSHCAACGQILVPQVIIPVLNHNWTEPEYTWSDDNKSVTAAHRCKAGEDHAETETVGTYSRIAQAATCENAGVMAYVSDRFINPAFSQQEAERGVINPIGHLWGKPGYEWSSDYNRVTGTCVCSRDPEHTITETASATVTIVSNPTYDRQGLESHTAVFENAAFSTQEKAVWTSALKDRKVLKLPADLTAIEEEAFAGINCEAVIIPDGCQRIETKAFTACTGLEYVWVPKTVEFIAEDAFDNSAELLIRYEGEHTNPILWVSTDSSTYDYGDSVTLTAAVAYPDGSTEGIETLYPDAQLLATLVTAEGETVPGFVVQGTTELSSSFHFPLAEEGMAAGEYRIRVTFNEAGLCEETDVFYYTADRSHLPDPSECRIQLSLNTATLTLNQKFVMTAKVTDKNGTPVNGIKVGFSIHDLNGNYTNFFTNYSMIWNVTTGEGTCAIGSIRDESSQFQSGQYVVHAVILDTGIADYQIFEFTR